MPENPSGRVSLQPHEGLRRVKPAFSGGCETRRNTKRTYDVQIGATDMKRLVAMLLVAAAATIGTAAVAGAEKPGPGDKQCIPGKQGNPHPGFKAGVCSNP
jgi:hypothetical protein